MAPLLAFMCVWMLFIAGAKAAERAQILATEEAGFGRLVITFPDRLDLPPYKVKYDNGVLAIEFTSPISVVLPDIAVICPAMPPLPAPIPTAGASASACAPASTSTAWKRARSSSST